MFTTRYDAVAQSDSAATPFSAIGDGQIAASPSAAAAASPLAKAAAALARLSLPAKAGFALAAALALGLGLGLGLRKPAAGAGADVCGWTDYRLPTNAAPLSYRITWAPTLTPDGAAFASGCPGGACPFLGATEVDVALLAPSPCILLHAAGLSIASATVLNARTGGGGAATWRVDAANERIVLAVPPAAGGAAGDTLRLTFAFSANLSLTNNGLYQSTYTNDAGATVYMVATQFEATAARKAFVSFDEPSYKANFTLVFDGVPRGYTALGNMPNVSAVARSDGASTVTFATSPRMSTYLLALVCGPLVSVAATVAAANGPLPLAGWAVDRANNSAALLYAVQAAAVIIPFYEGLFGVPFPLPKMDMAAIPDFAAGAMENWGLITYRETAMLATKGVNSASELQRVAVVVAHELAHQWNGDIVTMAWWNSLWLNEGFAARMEYLGTDAFAPEFGITQQFQSSTVIRALRADCFSAVQQLTQAVDSSAAIEGQFSSISYQKGASVLRMLQAFLADQEVSGVVAPNSFFRGVNTYLKRYVFGNSEPLGLWESLRDATGLQGLPAWAQTYELQPGFALIRVEWQDAGSEATGSGALTLQQARFFTSPASAAAATAAETARLYWVPLQLLSPGAARGAASAVPAAQALARTLPFTGAAWGAAIGSAATPFSLAADGWLKVGVNGSLYARVTYPPSLWEALFTAAAASQAGGGGAGAALSAADRATIIDDYMTICESTALAGEGINTAAGLAALLRLLPAERAYEPLAAALLHVTFFAALLVPDVPLALPQGTDPLRVDPLATPSDAACYASYNRFAASALAGAIGYVTWAPLPEETPLLTQLRASVLAAAALVNDTATVATARSKYAAYVASGGYPSGALPVDVASVVLNTAVRWGGDGEFFQVLEWYTAAQLAGDAAAYTRFLRALTATRSRALLQQALDLALGDDVRVGDKVGVLTGVAGNPFGRDLAWRYAVNDVVWPQLIALYGSGGFDTSALVGGLGGPFQTQQALDAVNKAWGAGGDFRGTIGGALFDLQGALEGVGRNLLWVSKEKVNACAYLKAF